MAAGDVTSIHPNGSAVTRKFPVDDTADSGGGGTVIDYTTFDSPWVALEPWSLVFFGNFYATAANATFFAADAPVTVTNFGPEI